MTSTRSAAEARVGTTLCSKWHIDRLIDIGGMAAVYAATHRNGNRVAVKVLHPQVAQDPEARERFLREGYAANRVGHPGAVTTLDDDEDEQGGVFLVMELLDGETLEARLGAGPLEPPVVLPIADAVLDVLQAAHAAGIIHRDIKPANVFLTRDGGLKILDFGFARVREASFDATATRDGVVIGTPSFMPPEQAQAKPDQIDHRSDLWALGATVFTALSGRPVHEGKSMVERLMAAMRRPAPSLASVMPGVSPELATWVDRALAFDRHDRWPDAAAMQRALRELSGGPIRPRDGNPAAPWLGEPAREPSVAFALIPKERRAEAPLETADTQLAPADPVTDSMFDTSLGDGVEDAGSSLLVSVEDVTGSMIEQVDAVTASMIESTDDEGSGSATS